MNRHSGSPGPLARDRGIPLAPWPGAPFFKGGNRKLPLLGWVGAPARLASTWRGSGASLPTRQVAALEAVGEEQLPHRALGPRHAAAQSGPRTTALEGRSRLTRRSVPGRPSSPGSGDTERPKGWLQRRARVGSRHGCLLSFERPRHHAAAGAVWRMARKPGLRPDLRRFKLQIRIASVSSRIRIRLECGGATGRRDEGTPARRRRLW